MNCQKANSLLSAYLDRELTPEERRLLRLHLFDCQECADELRDLEQVKTALGRLTLTRMPQILPWLRAQLAATADLQPAPVLVWQHTWFRRICAAAALLLMFGLGSWILLPQRRNGPAQDGNALPSLPDARWVDLRRTVP
ncbi:MAG: anti-sigma factor family protein [Patescibacteria group bacterium]